MANRCNTGSKGDVVETNVQRNIEEAHSCCVSEGQGSGDTASEQNVMLCPTNRTKGRKVSMTAVASLVRWEVEAARLVDSQYFLCPDPSCETVYFGSERAVIRKDDLRVRAGFKEVEDPITWCYCFNVTEADIQREVLETGKCPSRDHIVAEVKNGRCACHVKNPTGGCCLGDITKAMKRAQALRSPGASL